MKIGLIGLPQTGKKTLFELLTGHKPSESERASGKPIKGTADIRDPRFERLVALYHPKKEVRARIDIEMLPKIEKESIRTGEIFKDIEDTDAVCHIVRAFRDDSVYHVDGSVDPKRDIDLINSELVLNDLIFIEKRLERLDKDIKKSSDAAAKKDRELLLKLKAHLEKELPIRLLELDAEERKAIAHYPFITLKEMIIVLNVSEDDIKNTDLADRFRNDYKIFKIDLMQVSAKVEAEIALLETDEERRAFLEGLGIRESAVSALTQVCIKALDLISFFTVESDEVRQWTIRKGSLAHEAAGAIHSDLEKGFIRAEVIRYPDLEALGSEEKVREAGKLYIKGKDYIVEDGDIINIRFNV